MNERVAKCEYVLGTPSAEIARDSGAPLQHAEIVHAGRTNVRSADRVPDAQTCGEITVSFRGDRACWTHKLNVR